MAVRRTFRDVADDIAGVSSSSPTARDIELKSLDKVRRSLQWDAATELAKYGVLGPSLGQARFSVELPQGVQHWKYSWASPCSSTTSKHLLDDASQPGDQVFPPPNQEHGPLFPSSCRFNVETLKQWYKRIDTRGAGEITQKEFIVAMRTHRELLAMFSKMRGMELADSSDGRADPSQDWHAQREETLRIKAILKEVDTDGSGTLEWEEFVDFFRRTGMLLEYKTRRSACDERQGCT